MKIATKNGRATVDSTRCIALSSRPGSHIALDCMEEKVNLYLAETTKGKLRPDNCENLVSQAALHKNVLLPAMERIEEALNFGQTRKMTEGSRARPAEIDTIVAALEDRLGSTWAEFQSTPSHFNAVNADDIVRRYDAWRGTEAARIYVLERCEEHGLD